MTDDDHPRCETCLHWHDNWRTNLDGDNERQCHRLMSEDLKYEGLIASSLGEYGIRTRRDFGCILHEPLQ